MTTDLAVSKSDLDAIHARETWVHEARANQIPPKGNWDTLGVVAGRFFGKSRMLIEHGWYEAFRIPGIRVHALAPTIGDVRRVLFEGEAGFIAKIPPGLIASYNKSLHELRLTNGSQIIGFSLTEEANRLRGPACHLMIADEIAAADSPPGNLETAWKTAVFGCRLPYADGTPARKLFATTGKPIPFLRNLLKRPGTIVVRGSSYENIANVSPSVLTEVLAYEGTAFGRQEIHGDILDDVEHAIFKRHWFRLWPQDKPLPEFSFVLLTLDTAMEEEAFDAKRKKVDFSAAGVLGIFNTKQAFTAAELLKLNVRSKYAAVLCDFWMQRLGFPELLEKTRETYRLRFGKPGRRADVVLIENKSSGVSLRQTLQQYGVPTWPFNPAGQSKTLRAHTSSPLIAQGMLFVPESALPERKGSVRNWAEPLVEQMCGFSGEGSTEFDDAVDAITQAMLYLSQRGIFHAEPQQLGLPDKDEEDERKHIAAIAIAEREKRGKSSPYGA